MNVLPNRGHAVSSRGKSLGWLNTIDENRKRDAVGAIVRSRRYSRYTVGKTFVRSEVSSADGAPASSLMSEGISVSESGEFTAAGLQKKYWNWKGYKTAYVTAGCGEPLLLVHGFGASAGHFRRLIPVLAKKYKVYAVDLLGFGSSEKPIIEYSMEIWDEQIRDFLIEFVQKPVVIIGNSVGSLASLMASAEAPELVRGVVLLNCAGGMNNKQAIDDWRIKLVMPLFLLIDFLLKQPRIARRLFDNVREKETLRKILLGIYPSNPEAVDEDLVDMLHYPSCDVGALETFVSCITGPPGPRPETLIPKIKSPVLIIWGDSDSFTPSDGPVGKYFRSLPSSRSQTEFYHLPNVGHAPQDEAPELVLEHLSPWLDSVLTSRSHETEK